MKTCNIFSHRLLKLIYITLLPVLKAQKVEDLAEVTGYVGFDVTLPCPSIPGRNDVNITQMQWDLLKAEGTNKTTIIVFSSQFGEHIHESPLKVRVKVERQSLIIKDVLKADAGLYSCKLTTFPIGSVEGTTRLVIQEQKPLSTGILSAIVVSIILLLVILSATTYLIFIRKHDPEVRLRVHIDTSGQVAGAMRPSFIVREQEVVYADVKPKSSRNSTSSFNVNHKVTAPADDVTYSEVIVLRPQPQ